MVDLNYYPLASFLYRIVVA